MSDSEDDSDFHAMSVFSEILDGTADDDDHAIWAAFVPTSKFSLRNSKTSVWSSVAGAHEYYIMTHSLCGQHTKRLKTSKKDKKVKLSPCLTN
jgi:hypothetical protein